MIASFKDHATADLYHGKSVRRWGAIRAQALRKLLMLDAAVVLTDLRNPPGNRFEALHGDRAGQYSIRINAQWRVCFQWRDGAPHAVEICDYH